MKFLALTILFVSSASADTWKTGDYKIDLVKDADGNWVTSNCLKNCAIDEAASSYMKVHSFTPNDLAGGKNPGSVLCRKINGKVIYLNLDDLDDAFCELGKETVSLARVAKSIP